MKKVFFGVAVVAIALSASAFTNVSNKTVANEIVYLLNESGTEYTRYSTSGSLPAGSCTSGPSDACYIRFDSANDPGVQTFTPNDIPANDKPSSSQGYYDL